MRSWCWPRERGSTDPRHSWRRFSRSSKGRDGCAANGGGARSLDLDLLSVGGRIVDRPQLTLPHPRMMGRAFVLAPLCEVAPGWRHPVTAEGACEALERVGSESVVRTDLAWQLG